jgi:isocitrate/isopropylmalate dehydrogenase
MSHRVVLIPGDGTGPELTEATRTSQVADAIIEKLEAEVPA